MFWIRIQMWSESDLKNGKFLRVDNFPRRSSKNHIDPSKSGWAPHPRGFRIRRDAVTACESLTREDEPLLLWGDTFLLFNTLLYPLNLKKRRTGWQIRSFFDRIQSGLTGNLKTGSGSYCTEDKNAVLWIRSDLIRIQLWIFWVPGSGSMRIRIQPTVY